jgi:hypothetical protein
MTHYVVPRGAKPVAVRPRPPGGNSPGVTAAASASRPVPGGSRRPPGTQARSRRARPAATPARQQPESLTHSDMPRSPGPAGPAAAAGSLPAAPEAAGPGRQQLKLIWPADAVANAQRTCPRHNSTSADMHGTAIAQRADHLHCESTATRFTGRTARLDKTPGHDPKRALLRNRTRMFDLLLTMDHQGIAVAAI